MMVYSVALRKLDDKIAALKQEHAQVHFWQFRRRHHINWKLYRAEICREALRSEFHDLEFQPDEYQLLLTAEYNELRHARQIEALTT